jgi:exosortase O
MLFLLAATWLERRSLNLRWLGVALVFALLLLLTNFLRVGVLVTVGQVAGWPLAAEMLHIPLGVIGFGAACAGAVFMLRRGPDITALENLAPLNRRPYPLWLSPLLALALLLMIASYTSRPQTGLTQAPLAWRFPTALITEPLPLKSDEVEWLTRDGAESAERYRFEWRGLSGTMILITSNTWRAHHRPERCFEVYGLSLDASQTYLVNPNFPLRWVSLGDGTGLRQLSAAYWFQSREQTTDDYGTRIWADLAVQRQRWVLVSILFDETPEPNTPEVQALVLSLHQGVAQALGAPLQAASK